MESDSLNKTMDFSDTHLKVKLLFHPFCNILAQFLLKREWEREFFLTLCFAELFDFRSYPEVELAIWNCNILTKDNVYVLDCCKTSKHSCYLEGNS